MQTFTVTADHIKLIQRMYVSWFDAETGAPTIDPKRPYGNSDVAGDVAEILSWPALDDEGDEADPRYLEAMEIHRQMQTVLQIVLCTLSFKPGTYKRMTSYDERSWRAL